MNTDTGRIYEPEEHAQRKASAASAEDHRALMDTLESAEAKRNEKAEQKAFERAVAAGKIVEVSEEVARRVQTGQRVEERRRKRKATKAARRNNRPRGR